MTLIAKGTGMDFSEVFNMDGTPVQSPLGYPTLSTQFAPMNTGNEPDSGGDGAWWLLNEEPAPKTNANETRAGRQQIMQLVFVGLLVAGAVFIWKKV